MRATKLVKSFRMPFRHNIFNEGQRVWIVYLSGSEAAYVYGRHRGRNRYVHAWVSWWNEGRETPKIDEFDVEKDFHDRIMSRLPKGFKR